LIEVIPDNEFENLARKSVRILKEMYINYKFTNEGDIKERAMKYEERSNPAMKYVETYCEEDYINYVPLKVFSKEFNIYLKSKHLRSQTPKEIKKTLIEEGFDVRRTTKIGITDMYIIGIKLISIPLIPLIAFSDISTPHGILVEKKAINGINGIDLLLEALKILSKDNKLILREDLDNLPFENIDKQLEELKVDGILSEVKEGFYQLL
jgi:hypothetical protein